MKFKIYAVIFSFFCLELGWYSAVSYTLHLIDRRGDVLRIEDYSRLKEIGDKLRDDRFLFI